jgi:hypothetical protein
MSDAIPTTDTEALTEEEAGASAERQTDDAEAESRRAPRETGRRRGRPSRSRGRPLSSDEAAFRWTVRGVPVQVRALALRAAEERGMTVGDWLAEAIIAFARSDGQAAAAERRSNLPATDRPPDLVEMIRKIDERLTALEQRQPHGGGLFGRLFGRRGRADG